MWFVYILECSDSTYYTGVTNDLKIRLDKHNSGKGAKYTRGRLPVRLIYYEPAISQSRALKRERIIKKLTKKEKLKLITKVIYY